MPDKNNNPETEPKIESSSWDEIEQLSQKIKEVSEQSKLVDASGEKLNVEAQNNENLTEKDKENIEKATEEATDEAKKAETEAKEQIAEATGQEKNKEKIAESKKEKN